MTGRREEIALWPQGPRQAGDQLELAARLEQPGRASVLTWFRVGPGHRGKVAESADPFVLAALFPAMQSGRNLRVHGRVSPSLLGNLEDFQAAWHRWRPGRYTPIAVLAEEEADRDPGADDLAIFAFSGGLDSCFSAHRHTRGEAGRATRSLRAGVMVHGFDIPLDRPDDFASAAENSRRILDSIGIELIPVACNLKPVGSLLGVDWEDSHGALIAACLHLVGGNVSAGLIASTHSFDDLQLPWGSNPLTDPMLSSAGFAVRNDGGRYSRREKAAAVAEWPEAMRRLRVCWQGQLKDRNCGECPTCVHTAVCFVINGSDPPESIPITSLECAAKCVGRWPLSPRMMWLFRELVNDAREAGIEDRWVDAMSRAIRAGGRWDRLERRAPWMATPRLAWNLLRSPFRRARLEHRLGRHLGSPRPRIARRGRT
jgi:hypothetical protein